jgi:hypothetical protein
MKIKLGNTTYTGTREQFEKMVRGIDTEPETRTLPPWKREQLKKEIQRQIQAQK